VVHLDEEDQLTDDATVAFCMLEREILLCFFDIMTHLMIHLVEELFICGLVHCR
jgi:hypothetical protein